MKEDKLLNDLFESARTEEPKVSYEEVADSFIKTVPPTGVFESVRELLLSNISLNSVLMVVASGALLTAALVMSSPSQAESKEEVLSQNVIIDDKSISEKVTPVASEKNAEIEAPQVSNNKTNTSKEILKAKTETFFPKAKKIEKQAIVEVIETPENVVKEISSKPKKQSEPEVVNLEKEKDISTPENVVADDVQTAQPISNNSIGKAPLSKKINATNGYNELFTGYGTSLKRLKRSLLNKLINDGFIDDKKESVVIEIEEKKVVINGIKVKPYLYTKYTSIVQDFEIVPEKNRQIRIIGEMILVGDFTEQGFKGKGEGYGDQLYLPDFQKDIQLGGVPIDLSPVDYRKGKISLDEQIMQEILDLGQFDNIFKKDKSGQFLPLTLLTNNHFSDNLPLQHQGQSIKLIRGEASLSANAGLPIIYMRKYKFGRKKGTIKFLYDGYEITVLLKKSNSDWLMSRFQVSGKKENQIDVKF